jgi:hypothetical protein
MSKGKTKPARPEALQVVTQMGDDPKRTLAKAALRPSVRAGVTRRAYSRQFGELDLTALVDEIAAQNSSVSKGNMVRAEAMLMSQAHTLEAIFHELARRAALNIGEYLSAAETYMRLALKAQNQCARTIETLAAIKNPAPVTFVKQANVAHGPQQVNNGTIPEPSRARESESPPNKLLEQQHGTRLDTEASRTSVGADSSLETVGEIHRTENAAR